MKNEPDKINQSIIQDHPNYYNIFLRFIGGSIAASIGTLNGYPLDTIKAKSQIMKNINAFNIIKETYQKYGILGFYRGIEAPIISYTLGQTINFGINNNIKHWVKLNHIKNNNWTGYYNTFELVSMGAFSGACSSSVITASGRIKTCLQTNQTNKKTFDYFYNDIVKQKGIFGHYGLYKGWCATLLRDIPRMSVYFTTYNKVIQYWKPFNNLDKHSPIQHFLAGAFAGQLSWTVAYPFDMIKTTIQTSPHKLYIKDVFKEIYLKKGFKGFYKGYFFILLEAFPLHGTIFYINHLWCDYFKL